MKACILIISAGLILLSPLQGQEKKLTPVRSQTKRVTYKPAVYEIKSVRLLPDLEIKDFAFTDENSNKIIDPDEENEISLEVANNGKGIAEQVKFRISTKNPVPGISYNQVFDLGNIEPGRSAEIKIPIKSDMKIQNGSAEFRLEAVESRGFDSYPLEVTVETRQFQRPVVRIVDAVFSTDEGGRIVKNYPINLKILVQNIGRGVASDVRGKFLFIRENCIPLDASNNFEIGMLKPGQSAEIEFPFTATRRYTEDQIPIKIEIEEKYNQYARDTVVSVGLNQSLQASREVIIQGVNTDNFDFEIASLVAEVDRNIPVDKVKHPNKYALVIGNEDYTGRQQGIANESNVIYAKRDADIFKEYLVNTLGFFEENVTVLKDATAAEMTQSIDLVTKLAQRTKNAELVIFYAGHGFPDEVTQVPYLIPVDVTGTSLINAIKLTDLYRNLEASGAEKITVFLDACFSGGGRNSELLARRGIRIKPKVEIPPANTVVFSASSGEQSALPYSVKQHGMFTYYLLKKLQDTKGATTYGELASYLQTQVSLQSLKINQKEQDPQVLYGDNNRENWINKTIK